MAQIIDGKAIARDIKAETRRMVEVQTAAGSPPSLVALGVGDDPASELYARRQAKICEKLGIAYERVQLPAETPEEAVLEQIRALNRQEDVSGIIIQVPLPDHIDPRAARRALHPDKDVEGVHPENLGWLLSGRTTLVPPTAAAALACITSTGVPIEGAEAVVVGHSETVGKPTALLLMERLATVTVCHHGTRDVQAHTSRADILVVAVGKPALIAPQMVKPGAVVIDIGINEITHEDGSTSVTGDVHPGAADHAGWITPVPGGVGPVTVAMLLRNAAQAHG